MSIRGIGELVKEAVPAAGWTAGAGIVGAALTAPGWLIAIGQATVVVVIVLKGIDKRMERLHKAVNEARGMTETLKGRVDGLRCMTITPPPCVTEDSRADD